MHTYRYNDIFCIIISTYNVIYIYNNSNNNTNNNNSNNNNNAYIQNTIKQ